MVFLLSLRRFIFRFVDRLRAYKIAFRGLGEGRHSFDFVLDSAFFDCFESTKGTQGEIHATVDIRKSSLLMEVEIKMKGKVKGACDRCLGELEVPMAGEMNLYVKQSCREEGNEDDYIVISPEDDFLDMSSYLYETYMLHYPMRVVHPDGECEAEMQEVYQRYVREEDEKPIDPRWEELRKLINN